MENGVHQFGVTPLMSEGGQLLFMHNIVMNKLKTRTSIQIDMFIIFRFTAGKTANVENKSLLSKNDSKNVSNSLQNAENVNIQTSKFEVQVIKLKLHTKEHH